MGMIDKTNKSAYEYNKTVNETFKKICQPLFENVDITHFAYIKFLKDGSYFSLGNDIKWQEFYFKNDLVSKSDFFAERTNYLPKNTLHYSFWPLNPTDFTLLTLNNFNICHGIDICEFTDEGVEIHSFSTSSDKEYMRAFYRKEFPLLKRFIYYFQNQAQELIDTTNLEKLAFSNRYREIFDHHKMSHIDYQVMKLEKFLSQTRIKKHFIDPKKSVSISERELQCLYLLAQGNTVKEIGLKKNLSPKTVETYLSNVKLKLKCSSKNLLIDLFHSSPLKRYIEEIC